ncbi:hypothetical protein [Caulobacter segnis]|uniref:hypothetical protein n=1 Tax=Caulobacter segnis TaxID=88688 RepID=UPI002864711A|nr:hypothetical protein [Caulobacter segnis]MDR6626201.1 hypothetical protein [Caulobacter segnis]
MTEIQELLARTVASRKLKILVFGPQVATISPDERTAKLQKKRIEIREKLEALGHHVRYAEELVDPSLPGLMGNPVFQEMILMREYDFVATLVESPGSVVEATLIAGDDELARKASLFIDHDYRHGLAAKACEMAQARGCHFTTYKYPNDLDECNLYGMIADRVSHIQAVKYIF